MTTPPITDQPPPDLVALVEEYGRAERNTVGMSASISVHPDERRRVFAARDTAKAALLAALGRAPAPTSERVPSARWERNGGAGWLLRCGRWAGASVVRTRAGKFRWEAFATDMSEDDYESPEDSVLFDAQGDAGSLDAAQLAAEDALLAVRDEITRAVGR